MSELESIIERLEIKVKKLLHLQKNTEAERQKLEKQFNDLKTEVNEKNKRIKELEEKIKTVKLAKTITGEDNADLKRKIREMKKEIDNCLKYLDK
ncbi:MAG: hypothetical protein V2A54_00795 [Bacteroidota bacterium]|jgi:chromosome segregation ATPase